MELEVTPEPDGEERAALEAALGPAEEDAPTLPETSRWWRAGIEENVTT